MQLVELDYGQQTMIVEVPDSAFVVKPGTTYSEPTAADPVDVLTRRALADPLGLPPLADLVTPASRVVITFPDRVKGGTHAEAHRRVTIPIVIEELTRAGVQKSNIRLICAVGLHRKNTREEMAVYLPPSVLADPELTVVNHDAEDPDGILDFGLSALGDPVHFNRECAEADLCIVLGHCQGNPYGGFSGGFKSSTTGLTSWRSIAGHHVPKSMHKADFLPISGHSHFRRQLAEIGKVIEERMSGPLFEIDAVLADGSKVVEVAAGRVELVEQATWPAAARRTDVTLPIDPVDLLVFGLPRDFHYGPGMGTNPILVAQAIAAFVSRAGAAVRRGGVAIVAAWADGWFNDEWFPSYRETFDRYVAIRAVGQMAETRDEMCTRASLVDAYRTAHAYHPFHAFSMLSMAEISHQLLSSVIVVGAKQPEQMRQLGYLTVDTFEEAMAAAEDIVGSHPRMLVLPSIRDHTPTHLFAQGAS